MKLTSLCVLLEHLDRAVSRLGSSAYGTPQGADLAYRSVVYHSHDRYHMPQVCIDVYLRRVMSVAVMVTHPTDT